MFNRVVCIALIGWLSVCTASANKVKLPEWFNQIPENEYVGISEPGGCEEQALMMAFLQYLFANHAYGSLSSLSNGYSMQSNDIQESRYNEANNFVLVDTISYDIVNKKKLSSGEYVCLITSGKTYNSTISIFFEEYTKSVQKMKKGNRNDSIDTDIKVFITSNVGEWYILIKSLYVKDSSQIIWESVFTSQNGNKITYKPITFDTQYVEAVSEKTNQFDNVRGIGLSPYSICDNLLACYKMLFEKNKIMTFKYFDSLKDDTSQNAVVTDTNYMGDGVLTRPVVLQTPVCGFAVDLMYNIPGIYYYKENLSESDVAFIRKYVNRNKK